MARVKLDQPISAWGEATTCAALLDSGKAVVERLEHFGRNDTTRYFVTLLNTDGSVSDDYFEIGQKAYESRAAKGQDKAPTIPAAHPVLTGNVGEFLVSGLYYTGTWIGECYRISVPYDVMILMREAFEVSHEQATQDGGSTYSVEYNVRNVPVHTVTIPACDMHEGLPTNLLTVRLYWQCPVCGMERGQVQTGMSYDGSRRLQVHEWRNGCGHIDKYSAVRDEARANGLNL